MIRRWLLPLVIVIAAALAVLALRTPAPAPADAPAEAFSAARAMVDIRQIAQRPHPTGSPDNARVRAYLEVRLARLGLEVSTQSGALSGASVQRLSQWGDVKAADRRLVNIIGVWPGQDRSLPAVLMMAHHDTTWTSPGAADDTTGVAAILETVRALRARHDGPPPRDLIVLFTDAEELGLDGARAFFDGHPLAPRVGMVVNLEARGGGGRASMFETGPGAAQTVATYTRAMRGVEGGGYANAAAVLIYENMPNGTDYTIPRTQGVPGVNFAFTGRAAHYHTPLSTPEALDQGSVQHIGAQALAMTSALLDAPGLPVQDADSVYADILGLGFIVHPPAFGWVLLGLIVLLAAVAAVRARTVGDLPLVDLGRGLIEVVGFVAAGLVITAFLRALAGGPVHGAPDYYLMLARLPWLIPALGLGVLAAALTAMAGGPERQRAAATGLSMATVLTGLILGFTPVLIGAAIIAIAACLTPQGSGRGRWGRWLAPMAILFIVGVGLQTIAPTAAFLVIWPLTLAALAAAVGALIDPSLRRAVSLAPAVIASVIGGAWLIALGHGALLGVGMDLPGVAVVVGLLVLVLIRPLASESRGGKRGLRIAGLILIGAAIVLAVGARLAEPVSPLEAAPASAAA